MAEQTKVTTLEKVVIRFSGDSGDGMQLTGTIFSNLSAIFGNEISTFPDYPAEVRAPQGTLSGVSGFQVHLGSRKIFTPGDKADVLVAMNPAALKVNVKNLKPNAIVIIDTDSFQKSDLDKALFTTDDPFKELGLGGVQVVAAPISTMVKDGLAEFGLDNKSALRCKNMFALGLVCWLFERPLEEAMHMLQNKFAKKPAIAQANIKALTDGDFTVSVKSSGNDEIALMSRSVERFIASMKQMIASMGDISGKLGTQADASDSVSREMQSAANVQSQSMSELNMTVDQLSVSVNEIADNATKLAGVVADTKDDSVNVGNKMRETVEVSQKGREDMEHVGEALENIRTSIQNLEAAVNKVGTASGEIVEIVQLIGNIAEETNLLSLNASIEAARAGEAGRGFAVVASEIGTLASNSTASVEHISKLIHEVNELVADAVRQAGDSADNINESSGLIHTAIDTFDRIYDNIQQTSALIDQMVDKINQVDEVATNVAAISEEQAASSDEILATSESMLTQAKGIAENSENVAKESRSLTESSIQLADQVKLFRI